MKRLSLGDFYISIDKEFFFDLQLHIGKLRVEWSGPPALPRRGGSFPQPSNQRTAGEGS